MTAKERGESVAKWLENLADIHDERGKDDMQNAPYHRGIATLYRARASDVRAELDIPIVADEV